MVQLSLIYIWFEFLPLSVILVMFPFIWIWKICDWSTFITWFFDICTYVHFLSRQNSKNYLIQKLLDTLCTMLFFL